ncbi:hypothetical protein QBA54_42870 [Streptomyces sp. B21-108]|uniref:hypothetical protein n=1 Tax=Streptomyces sp. B21-108 TaxID=3039419 RepID=UPI002FEF3200
MDARGAGLTRVLDGTLPSLPLFSALDGIGEGEVPDGDSVLFGVCVPVAVGNVVWGPEPGLRAACIAGSTFLGDGGVGGDSGEFTGAVVNFVESAGELLRRVNRGGVDACGFTGVWENGGDGTGEVSGTIPGEGLVTGTFTGILRDVGSDTGAGVTDGVRGDSTGAGVTDGVRGDSTGAGVTDGVRGDSTGAGVTDGVRGDSTEGVVTRRSVGGVGSSGFGTIGDVNVCPLPVDARPVGTSGVLGLLSVRSGSFSWSMGRALLSGGVMCDGETWLRVRVSTEYWPASECNTVRMSSVIILTISGLWLTGMSPFFIGLMPMFSACCAYQWLMVWMFALATARSFPASTRVCATEEPMFPPASASVPEATCLEKVCIMVMKASAAAPCHGESLVPAKALA